MPALGRNPPSPLVSHTDAAVVVLSDTVDIVTGPSRALYIGVAGALKVITVDGSTVTFPNVVAGKLDLQVTRVFTTGTAATGIIALY